MGIKIMGVSAEQKKKRATERKRQAAEAKEKRRLAKVPQRKGGTAAPKLYKKPSKEAIAKGQKEIESTSPHRSTTIGLLKNLSQIEIREPSGMLVEAVNVVNYEAQIYL